MMETITLRLSQEEWRKDLDLSMIPLGIYRVQHYKQGLFDQLKKLESLLREYQGIHAMLKYSEVEIEPYWYKLEVCVNHARLKFQAFVCYEINEEQQLVATIYCTNRPSTDEFPIEGGVEWKTIVLNDSEIKDPAYVVAHIKNHFICFESYRQIGRDILYAVLEE
ncbi:MAG: hypothetical protein RLZZ198_606 [Bacteroidota bacterium]|jgi:hypothetical protein